MCEGQDPWNQKKHILIKSVKSAQPFTFLHTRPAEQSKKRFLMEDELKQNISDWRSKEILKQCIAKKE